MKLRFPLIFALLLTFIFSGVAPGQTVVHDVIYQKEGGAAFTMDVFKPEHPNGTAVIWLVSGGWVSHHEDIRPELGTLFNAQGITVFEVVHGAQPRYIIPEILKMLTHAVRFVHANAATYGVDPNRIGIAGASAGGHLSLMLAGAGDAGDPNAKDPVDRAPSTVKAVVAFFPPTDFMNWGDDGKAAFKNPLLAIFMPAFGFNKSTPEDTMTQSGIALSPIHEVTAKFPPTLLIHGDKDMLVPVQQSKIMDAAFEKAGVKHKLIIIPGTGHDGNTFVAGVTEFLKWFQANL